MALAHFIMQVCIDHCTDALIQCISQDRSLWGGGELLQREDPRISIEVVTCRKKVAVDGSCSLLLRCCSVVAETVADGFRCLVYVHFGTFETDDSIDKVSAGTHKVVSEVVGLFGDQGGDGVVRQEFRACSTEGTVTGFNTITFCGEAG